MFFGPPLFPAVVKFELYLPRICVTYKCKLDKFQGFSNCRMLKRWVFVQVVTHGLELTLPTPDEDDEGEEEGQNHDLTKQFGSAGLRAAEYLPDLIPFLKQHPELKAISKVVQVGIHNARNGNRIKAPEGRLSYYTHLHPIRGYLNYTSHLLPPFQCMLGNAVWSTLHGIMWHTVTHLFVLQCFLHQGLIVTVSRISQKSCSATQIWERLKPTCQNVWEQILKCLFPSKTTCKYICYAV